MCLLFRLCASLRDTKGHLAQDLASQILPGSERQMSVLSLGWGGGHMRLQGQIYTWSPSPQLGQLNDPPLSTQYRGDRAQLWLCDGVSRT